MLDLLLKRHSQAGLQMFFTTHPRLETKRNPAFSPKDF
jgi:hypothetical protein